MQVWMVPKQEKTIYLCTLFISYKMFVIPYKHKGCFSCLSVGNGDLNLYTGFDGDGGDLLHDLWRGVEVDHALVDAHLEWKVETLKLNLLQANMSVFPLK